MLIVLSMVATLAAFFAIMLYLDPRRYEGAAKAAGVTAVAIGAAVFTERVPTVGGDAFAQDDAPETITVYGHRCTRSGAGYVCNGHTLSDFCNMFSGSGGEDNGWCYGASNGGGGGGGSSGGSGGSIFSTYIPPKPECPCGEATWQNGNSGASYGRAIGGHWECPHVSTCPVTTEVVVDVVVPAVCVGAVMAATGAVCGAVMPAGATAGAVCGVLAGSLASIASICPSFGHRETHR